VIGGAAYRPSGQRRSTYERTSGSVSTGMGDRLQASIPPGHVTSQLGQLSLASLRLLLAKAYTTLIWLR